MYFKKLYNPYLFQGRRKKKNYFEGYYYKLVSKDEKTMVAFIPGVSVGEDGHSFIQVFLSSSDGVLEKTYHSFPSDQFSYKDDPFLIKIHDNSFSLDRIDLNLINEDISVIGKITIKDIKPFERRFLQPNIMGFFGYLNFMECYHGLVSMNSNIDGLLVIDDIVVDFNGGKLYIEKDWGKSFPSAYVWLQSNHFKDPETGFMFSYAHIPFIGLKFTGLISYLTLRGKSYLFATYNMSKVKKEVITDKSVIYTLKRKDLTLEIHATQKETVSLPAPKKGRMIDQIKEGLSGEISIKLYQKNELIYEDTGKHAGIEIMKAQKN